MDEQYVTKDDLSLFGKRIDDLGNTSRVALKDYIDSRFESIKEATNRARESMETRLQGMNEFRQTLRDQSTKFVVTGECKGAQKKYDERLKSIDESLRSLELTRATLEGKASRTSAMVAVFVGILGVLLGLSSLMVAVLKLNT